MSSSPISLAHNVPHSMYYRSGASPARHYATLPKTGIGSRLVHLSATNTISLQVSLSHHHRSSPARAPVLCCVPCFHSAHGTAVLRLPHHQAGNSMPPPGLTDSMLSFWASNIFMKGKSAMQPGHIISWLLLFVKKQPFLIILLHIPGIFLCAVTPKNLQKENMKTKI